MQQVDPDEKFEETVEKDLEVSRASRKLEDFMTNIAKD